MQSPAIHLHELVESFQSQHLDPDGFLQGLTEVENYVAFFQQRLAALVPSDDPEAEAVQQCVAACLENYLSAVEELRAFADSRQESHLSECLRLTHEADTGLRTLLQENRERAAQCVSAFGLAE